MGRSCIRAAVVAVPMLLVLPAHADHELEGRDIAKGQELYASNCAACHGPDLEGQPNWRTGVPGGSLPAPPHNETGHTWHHDNQLLFDYTKFGGRGALAQRGISDFNSGMPAFELMLGDDDIWDILAFIRSTWPKQLQEVQAARNPQH